MSCLYQHIKTGGVYELIGAGIFSACSLANVCDMAYCDVYIRRDNGKFFIKPSSETLPRDLVGSKFCYEARLQIERPCVFTICNIYKSTRDNGMWVRPCDEFRPRFKNVQK